MSDNSARAEEAMLSLLQEAHVKAVDALKETTSKARKLAKKAEEAGRKVIDHKEKMAETRGYKRGLKRSKSPSPLQDDRDNKKADADVDTAWLYIY